jgi:hypothetical protein
MNTTPSMKNCTHLGTTEDMIHRVVDVYEDGEFMYAVYEEGTSDEYITSVLINLVEKNPDKYMFTPYVEFAHLV